MYVNGDQKIRNKKGNLIVKHRMMNLFFTLTSGLQPIQPLSLQQQIWRLHGYNQINDWNDDWNDWNVQSGFAIFHHSEVAIIEVYTY